MSGCPPHYLKALVSYGRSLGLAYHLTDDVLEISDTGGKPGSLLRMNMTKGIYNLPLLKAVQRKGRGSDRLRTLLAQPYRTTMEVDEMLQLVRTSGVVDEVVRIAHGLAQQAQAALMPMPDGPARLSLSRLAAYAVNREVSNKQESGPLQRS
jgi:heptaprenyl diphosphate synthase